MRIVHSFIIGVVAILLSTTPVLAVYQTNSTFEYSEIIQIGLKRPLFSVAWNSLGDLILVSGEDGVYLFTSDFEQVAHFKFGDKPFIVSTVWSPNDQMAASLAYDGQVYIWNVADGNVLTTWRSHDFVIPSSIAWSPDESKIAVGGGDGTVTVYDPVQRTELNILDGEEFGAINSVIWHPNSYWLTFGTRTNPEVIVWDVEQNERIGRILLDTEYIIARNPDGSLMALAGVIPSKYDIPAQAVIYIWSMLEELDPLRTILVDTYGELEFYSLAWHPEGVLLAGYNHDQQIRIWDVNSGQLITQLPGTRRLSTGDVPSYNSLAWNPDGTMLADVGSDGIFRVWGFIESTHE